MKKHKRKALRKAFTAVFSLTLIALALVAYGLLCWRAGQYKIILGTKPVGQAVDTKVAPSFGVGSLATRQMGSNPAVSTPLPQRPEKVEGQDFSSSTEGRAAAPQRASSESEARTEVKTSGAAEDSTASRNQARPTEFTSKPKAKHPTTASGASSNPMPGYPEKWADPKQSVWLYRDEDRSKE